MPNFYKQKPLANVKYTPRVLFILLTVEKIEHEHFDFVLLLLSYSSHLCKKKNCTAPTN